MSEKTGLRTR